MAALTPPPRDVGEYAVHAWVRPFLSLLPFAAASVAVDRTWPASNLLMFFLQVIAVTCTPRDTC